MEGLRAELAVLPVEERETALKYYEEYFADAGAENEQSVIAELGTPQIVANRIKGDFYGNNPSAGAPAAPPKASGMPLWLIVLIAVFAIPVGIPLAAGLFGALIGILAALFSVAVAVIVSGVSIFAAGIAAVVTGILMLAAEPLSGMLLGAAGLILIGVGMLITLAIIRLIPVFIRWVVKICKLPFRKRGAKV